MMSMFISRLKIETVKKKKNFFFRCTCDVLDGDSLGSEPLKLCFTSHKNISFVFTLKVARRSYWIANRNVIFTASVSV